VTRPRILLVGGTPLLADLLTEYLDQADRYDLESAELLGMGWSRR